MDQQINSHNRIAYIFIQIILFFNFYFVMFVYNKLFLDFYTKQNYIKQILKIKMESRKLLLNGKKRSSERHV